MEISWVEFLLLALASFRLTRLIVYDKITEFIRNPFIDEIVEVNEAGESETYYVPKKGLIKGFFGELLSCYWCTGVWSSIALSVLFLLQPNIATPIILVLAVAGLGALIETLLQKWLNN